MAPFSRFPKAAKSVKEFFSNSTQKVFTLEELDFIFQKHATEWSSRVTNVEDFAKQLVQSNILEANKFDFEERIKSQIRFWVRSADIYDIALSLVPGAHLSHITALFLNGIISKPPRHIYLTSEQSEKVSKVNTDELEQDNVDYAFSKPQRHTNIKCIYSGKEIAALTSKFTGGIGVINISGKQVTSLERTLIDITVRPSYGGGVMEVFKAFIKARDRISIDILLSFLDAIDYIYPYYQSIGFYLEKAGYNSSHIQELKKKKKFIDFYLDYTIENPSYSKDWRLFYPKILDAKIQI